MEEGSDADLMLREQTACPTVFDAAQANIFNLMNTDSFPRYRCFGLRARLQFLVKPCLWFVWYCQTDP